MKHVIFVVCLVLAACTATGQRFNADKITQLKPGVTTMADASRLFGAQPQQIITLGGGAKNAHWRYIVASPVSAKLVEVGLNFAGNGTLQRVVMLSNVPADDATLARLNPMSITK